MIPRGAVWSSAGTSSTLVSEKMWNPPICCWKEVNCLNYSVLLWLPSLTRRRYNHYPIISYWIQTLITEWLQQIRKRIILIRIIPFLFQYPSSKQDHWLTPENREKDFIEFLPYYWIQSLITEWLQQIGNRRVMDWIEFRLKQILLEELFEVPKEQVLLWWAKFNERPQFAVEWGNSDWMHPSTLVSEIQWKTPICCGMR